MSYEIIITADGASIPQLAEARSQFRHVLEDRLGGPESFKPAFMAHTKRYDQGNNALSPEEVELAAAWSIAYADADGAAKAILAPAKGINILVRLAT